jgi:hypothetical protein
VEPVRHRQTKGAGTDMFDLQPPRHTPTLPSSPIRSVVAHRLQSADSGRSPNRDQTFGLAVIRRGELIVLIENNVVVHTDHGMIWLGGRSDEVRK